MHPPTIPTLAQDEPPIIPSSPMGGAASAQEGGAPGGTGQPSTGDGGPGGPPSQPGIFNFLPLFLILAVFFVFMMGGQRKEKKRRAKMLAGIGKGDKVQTVGGILGTIVEMRETEVVLKVDENANTRIKFSRSAIQSVVSERQEAVA